MRKVYVIFAVVGILISVLASAIFALEYNRTQNLCRLNHSHIATGHDAMDVIRNYREDLGPVGRILSVARQLDAFRSDGYALSRTDDERVKGGGWRVKEWNKPLITLGYSVDFEYFNVEFHPEIEVKCDVLECGAIDVSENCLTFGAFYSRPSGRGID